MRYLAMVGVLCALCLPVHSQTTPDQGRSITASGWLSDLCVVPVNGLWDMSLADLNKAFDDWRQGKMNTTACEPTAQIDNQPTPELNLKETKLYPSVRDRLLRLAEFSAEAQQTPDYVYGVPENAPAGTASTFLGNTDHGIFSYGGPVHFDELFVSADQRVALCEAIGAASSPGITKQVSEERRKIIIDRGHCYDERYMATSRYRDRFARIGSSVTLNFRYSQIPLFESGVLISPSSPNLQKWSATVTGSFDTSKLYRSQAEASALASYMAANIKNMIPAEAADQNFNIDVVCGAGATAEVSQSPIMTNRCIGKFAAGGYLQRSLLFVLPVISVKVTSPFDLAKYGSTFEEPPNHSGRSLYDVTFTWNAQKVFPNAASIVSAIKTADTLLAMSKPSAPAVTQATVLTPAEQEWRRQVKALYMELKLTPTVANNDHWWDKLRNTVIR